MNNFLKIFFLTIFAFILTNCTTTDDEIPATPINDFGEQYTTDTANIKKFLQTHSVTVDANNNVTGYPAVLPADIANSIWGAVDAIHKPSLLERTITYNGTNYIVYYLKLNQGIGDYPCNVDSAQVDYIGSLLPTVASDAVATPFQIGDNKIFFNLNPFLQQPVIRGWSEIIPQFNAATTLNSFDYGAGVMFIPSGFAYFNASSTKIPSYSPLIFSFKLFGVIHLDQDNDGILSVNEDLNADRYVTTEDTDGDGRANFNDGDDDNDNVLTAFEIKRPKVVVNGVLVENGSYPYNGAAQDDPLTLNIDESKGVPACGDIDFTTPARIRKYLDAGCK